eukprot:4528984-Alexandrium_andersonii.AAC.1
MSIAMDFSNDIVLVHADANFLNTLCFLSCVRHEYRCPWFCSCVPKWRAKWCFGLSVSSG